MLLQVDDVVSENMIDLFAYRAIGVEDEDDWYLSDDLVPLEALVVELETISCLIDFVGATHVLQRWILVDANA